MATINELVINYPWEKPIPLHLNGGAPARKRQFNLNIFKNRMRFFVSLHKAPQPCKWLAGGDRYEV